MRTVNSDPGTDNVNCNNHDNDIIFTIKDTKLYVPVVNLSAREIKNHQNFLVKDLKDQFIGMNIKQKVIKKNTTSEFIFFLWSNFVGVSRLLVLVHSNQDAAYKRFKAKRYYLPKGIIDN